MCHEQALQLKRELGDKLGAATSLGNLGAIARLEQRFGQAIMFHHEALEVVRALGHPEVEALLLANLALVFRDQGDVQTALVHQNEALALAERLMRPEVLWRVRASRGETYRRLGDVPAAVADLTAAVSDIEGVRDRLSQDDEKLTFFGEDKETIYARLVVLFHAELGHEARALEYVERARSRLFLDQLAFLVAQIGQTEPLSYKEILHYLSESVSN
jgi:tetratricopeptide (TPR) repeat protein